MGSSGVAGSVAVGDLSMERFRPSVDARSLLALRSAEKKTLSLMTRIGRERGTYVLKRRSPCMTIVLCDDDPAK